MAKWHGGYDWLDAISDLTKEEEKPSAPKNEQAAGVGVDTYARYAQPFGTIDKTKPSNLKFYNYGGKGNEVNKLANDSGYQVYYMGGKHGMPDLANKHYGTGHLAIWDPSSGSGGDFGEEDYTRNWRIAHETSHGQTLGELNKLYGDGRRMGKLGHHRTLREALRSVHWEWLAGHKQRELSRQMGVHLTDEDFAREMNTVMHDAAHRAVTGKFTEPSGEGFHPHSRLMPLDSTLNMIREAAREKGLKGMDDLIIRPNKRILTKTQSSLQNLRKRAMTDKTYTLPEIKQELTKALKLRVEEFGKEMLALRKKELAKSDACLLCGHADLPGSCTCLSKAEVEKCDTDEVKKLGKDECCTVCGKTECCCGEIETKAKEPVKAQEGSGGKVSKLTKDAMAPGGKLPTGSIEDMAMNEPSVKKCNIPGRGRKLTKNAAKDMQAMANQASYEAHTQAATPAPKVKLPSVADNAARADSLQDFMPAGKFTPGGAGLPHERSPLLNRKLGKAGLNFTKPAAPTKLAGAATPAVSKPPSNNAPKPSAPKAPSPASAPGAKDLK